MKCRIKRLAVLPPAAVLLIAALLWSGSPTPAAVVLPSGPPVLVIDAGHGGEDGGAVSRSGQVESQINLAVALRLDALMGFAGVPSVLLRQEDISLHDSGAETLREKKRSDLENRVERINETDNAVLISIHQNTFSDSSYHGAQVFYADEESSLPLAQAAQDALRRFLDPDNQRQPAKISDDIYLMAHVERPAILAECGFLSNPEEDALLGTEAWQLRIALALAGAYWDTYYG